MTVSRTYRPPGRWHAPSSRHGRDRHDRPCADLQPFCGEGPDRLCPLHFPVAA